MSPTLAKGSQIGRGDGASPEAFGQILGVTEITLPNPETEDIETTNHDTTGREKTYVPGLIEPGDMSFLYTYDKSDSEHIGIETDRAAGTLRNWQTTVPVSPADTATFSAYVKSNEIVTDIGGIITKRASLKVAGPAT